MTKEFYTGTPTEFTTYNDAAMVANGIPPEGIIGYKSGVELPEGTNVEDWVCNTTNNKILAPENKRKDTWSIIEENHPSNGDCIWRHHDYHDVGFTAIDVDEARAAGYFSDSN